MPSRWDEPFRTLVVHFFHRFFDTDSPSQESVPRTRLIQSLSLIGVLIPMLMFFLVGAEEKVQLQMGGLDFLWLRAGIHYTFVCYAMGVMGLVMTFKWDALFPDGRDYVILTSLPISGKRLFAAKAVAVCIFLLLFVLATNFVLMIAVAFIEPGALAGHVVGVLGSSIFAALFFAAIQGVLVNLLTPGAFRRISPSIQMVAIALLITLLLVMPLIAASLRPLVLADSSLLDYFPPVWFLGVYESLSSSPSVMPKATAWAWTALEMIGLTAVAVVLSYVVGYRRHSRKILEGVESANLTPGWWSTLRRDFMNKCLLMNSFQSAAFEFVDKISERSPKHRISAALYSGLGLALALSSLFVIDRREAFPFQFSMSGVLRAPAVLSFLTIAGWRATFSVPYELSANWVFQMADRRSAVEFRKAIRKWVYVCRIVPLYGVLAFFEFALFDKDTAISHLAFDLITTAFLTEAFFFGFRKVPFSCPYLQGKLQLAFYAVAYLYAYTTYTSLMADLKRWVAANPQHLTRFLAVSAILSGCLLIYRALTRAEASRMIYEEPDPVFQQLNLS